LILKTEKISGLAEAMSGHLPPFLRKCQREGAKQLRDCNIKVSGTTKPSSGILLTRVSTNLMQVPDIVALHDTGEEQLAPYLEPIYAELKATISPKGRIRYLWERNISVQDRQTPNNAISE
jgi:hypothetical protein